MFSKLKEFFLKTKNTEPVAIEKKTRNIQRIKLIILTIVFGAVIIGLWVLSLTSPDFNISPTQLPGNTSEDHEQQPLFEAVKSVGGIFEKSREENENIPGFE